jgi:response regulator of citrate/malate metabolism
VHIISGLNGYLLDALEVRQEQVLEGFVRKKKRLEELANLSEDEINQKAKELKLSQQ